MNKTVSTKQQKMIEQRLRVKVLSELLIDNTTEYITALSNSDYPTPGCSFDKHSNASKTALKAQITTLRNELLKLSKELE